MKAKREWCSTTRVMYGPNRLKNPRRVRCQKCGRMLALSEDHSDYDRDFLYLPAHKGKYKVQRATKSGDDDVSRRRINIRH